MKKRGNKRVKKMIILIQILLLCIAGCESSNLPIELPFAAHKVGTSVSTELRIITDQKYYFSLMFMFNENDAKDRARVKKQAGEGGIYTLTGESITPGIPIPLKLKITTVDSSGERLFLEKQVCKGILSAEGSNHYIRDIDLIYLPQGRYRVSVQTLKDIPELADTKVVFMIHRGIGK